MRPEGEGVAGGWSLGRGEVLATRAGSTCLQVDSCHFTAHVAEGVGLGRRIADDRGLAQPLDTTRGREEEGEKRERGRKREEGRKR